MSDGCGQSVPAHLEERDVPMIKSIALANLTLSPNNVRRTSDEAADARLAADIAARGLLNNLLVTPTKPKGMFAVEAGGRRLRALHKLQFDGVLPVDHKVACLVLDGADEAAATEASLAENFQRLAMNPADECLAFGRLIEEGADVEGVARRFGLTVRFVEGRLRLANLAPVVFAALGAGEITLDAAKAYAATSDQERQAYVFEQLNAACGGAHPESIRRMMVNATIPASDRRFRFVGEDAYVAAGGRIERDLFEDESQARLLDVAILERLAIDKLDAEADRLRKDLGYGFVRLTLDHYVQAWQHGDLRRVAIEAPQPSDEERAEIEALETEIESHVAVYEDEDADGAAIAEAEEKITALNARINAILDKPLEIDPELKPAVGMFLMLDADGAPRLDRSVYALIGEDDAADEGDGDGRDYGPGSATGERSAPTGDAKGNGASVSAEPKPAKLSQRLVDELAMQRRDVLALHVAADPALALDLAVVLMLADEGGYAWDGGGSTLTARRPSDPVLTAAMPAEAPAIAEAKARAAEALDRSWLDRNSMAERFDAFRALAQEQREAWLGHAVARTLEASVFGGSQKTCAFHDHLGRLLGIDVARWWRPTALSWFDRVAKAQCLAALEEVGGSELAARHAKAKKGEIAEACERVFAGAAIVEAAVKTRALAWLPGPMRFDDGAPPWDVETSSTAVGQDEGLAADDIAIVLSDETAVTDAAASEPETGAEGSKPETEVGSPGEPSSEAPAEPIAVRFVPDDPALKGVSFAFGECADEGGRPEDQAPEVGIDLAA